MISLLGAVAMRLAAATLGVRARIVFGIGPRLGAKDREPTIDVRPGLVWCWARLVDGRGARSIAVRASGPIAMALVPFLALVITAMVVGVERSDPGPPLIVGDVVPGTPAARSGVQRGDRIVAIDGRTTPDVDTLRSEIGERVEPRELTVDRRGQRLVIQIVPERTGDRVLIGISARTIREHPGVLDAVVMSARGIIVTWSAVLEWVLRGTRDEIATPSGIIAMGQAHTSELIVSLVLSWSAISILWALIAAIGQIAAAIQTARTTSRDARPE